MTTAIQPIPARSTFAEQFDPVLRIHAEVSAGCAPLLDVDAARARIKLGQVAYDALRVLRSCGDLYPRFIRVLDAFEVAGFVSNDDRHAIIDAEPDVDDLVSGWFTGDRTPRDARRRLARQVRSWSATPSSAHRARSWGRPAPGSSGRASSARAAAARRISC